MSETFIVQETYTIWQFVRVRDEKNTAFNSGKWWNKMDRYQSRIETMGVCLIFIYSIEKERERESGEGIMSPNRRNMWDTVDGDMLLKIWRFIPHWMLLRSWMEKYMMVAFPMPHLSCCPGILTQSHPSLVQSLFLMVKSYYSGVSICIYM